MLTDPVVTISVLPTRGVTIGVERKAGVTVAFKV